MAAAYSRFKLEKITYNHVLQVSSIPRLKFDKYFIEAVNQGLVSKDMFSQVSFTPKGLEYAEEHGLAG